MEVIIASGRGGGWILKENSGGGTLLYWYNPKGPWITDLFTNTWNLLRFDSTTAEVHDDASPCEFLLRQWATKTTASQQWLEQHKQQRTCTVYCKKRTATYKAGVGKVWQQYKMWMTSSEWERFLPDNSILTKSWRVTIATRLSSSVDGRRYNKVQGYTTTWFTNTYRGTRVRHTGILTPRTPHRHSHTAPL